MVGTSFSMEISMIHERFTATPKELVETAVRPEIARTMTDESLFLDFGKAAFGTIVFSLSADTNRRSIVVHFGEMMSDAGRIEREPPGSIFYLRTEHPIAAGERDIRIIIPPNERNTGTGAIRMPEAIGEVCPFRYAEIEHADDIDVDSIHQICVHYPFSEEAAHFESSDETLNAVWELCKYSIKATSFCGVYVDGNRERIPYEADAYINQLSHYCVDAEYDMARYTHEYLLQYPTWPTEWQLFSVLIAWQDYLYTGDTRSIELFYNDLCVKTLLDLAGDDGLISTEAEACSREFEERLHLYHSRYVFGHGLQDIVDWPPGSFTVGGQGERDDHEMRPINTVVNAFHYHALVLMSRIAAAIGRMDDESRFSERAVMVRESINNKLFDDLRGVYIDGVGSHHASLHSNMFALAFGLVPSNRKRPVLDFVKSRGMACSVYATQFLLEALYASDEDDYPLELLTPKDDRSWWNMISAGSTVTLEAWDWKYKNNLDWNHAWGAAPANIIPRFLMGVRPIEPGYRRCIIEPQPGSLAHAILRHPTPLGPICIRYENREGMQRYLEIEIPDGMTADVILQVIEAEPEPEDGDADGGRAIRAVVDEMSVDLIVVNRKVSFPQVESGRHTFEYSIQVS
jgi:alpha-L-rhamnosidase